MRHEGSRPGRQAAPRRTARQEAYLKYFTYQPETRFWHFQLIAGRALARSIASATLTAKVNSPPSGCSPGRCVTMKNGRPQSLGAIHRPV
jgi:hypothetical protein